MSRGQTAFAWHGAGEGIQNWATPRGLFLEIQRRFAWDSIFTIDSMAEAWSAKCERFITKEMDCFRTPWGDPRAPGHSFTNPEFADIGPPMKEAIRQIEIGNLEQAVFLIPMRTDRRWWNDLVRPYARRVEPIEGRIAFEPPPGFREMYPDRRPTSHGEPCGVVIFERKLVAIGWSPSRENADQLEIAGGTDDE